MGRVADADINRSGWQLKDPKRQYDLEFSIKGPVPNWKPRVNFCPTNSGPFIVADGGERHMRIGHWGLIPEWAKEPKMTLPTFNARAETVREKNTFRSAFKKRRCVVPMDAFYEWSGPKTDRIPHEISRVVRGRAANPKWIAGVMRHGYKGAFEIAATVDYLFGFAASTDAVGNHHFDQLFAAYLEDERVRGFMAEANPAALHETAARFNEAIRRGLWTPRSNSAGNLIAALLSAPSTQETAA